MLLQLLIFAAGLGVLYLGAEWLVKGAATLALRYGIRRIVVGITVVALGTSMPEFVVNFFAALSEEHSLALGNIVGSNICNIALILGASALVLPMKVAPGTLKREYPIMMFVLFVFYAFAWDGVISQVDGLLLVAGLVGFFTFLVIDHKRDASGRTAEEVPEAEAEAEEARMPAWKQTTLLIVGMIFLAAGARAMVYAAVNIADTLGVDPVIVGLTVVAIGTSLPELAASMVSAMNQESDLSIGNVLGSNLLNVLFVVGLVSLISPLSVDAEALRIHFPVMLGFAIVLLPLAWTNFKISRFEGGMLLAGFVGYLAYLVVPYL